VIHDIDVGGMNGGPIVNRVDRRVAFGVPFKQTDDQPFVDSESWLSSLTVSEAVSTPCAVSTHWLTEAKSTPWSSTLYPTFAGSPEPSDPASSTTHPSETSRPSLIPSITTHPSETSRPTPIPSISMHPSETSRPTPMPSISKSPTSSPLPTLSWRHQAKLPFGERVAIYQDTIVVGGRGFDDNGSAQVFARSGGEWTHQVELLAPDGTALGFFGDKNSVAIHKDTIVVGDKGDRSESAHVFVRSEGGWAHQAMLLAQDADDYNWFGKSVAIHEDTIVVGAPTRLFRW
ncbi:hypothetical protein THAOC_24794, partial [Thalassiosira oceanica]